MKSLSSFVILLALAFISDNLYSQDTLKLNKVTNPPNTIRNLIKIDSVFPPVTCNSLEDGKKAALRDISKNIIHIQMNDERWCIWHDHFSDLLTEKYNIRVTWEYDEKSSEYFDENYCRNSGYSIGYFTTMDSVLSQRISDSELSEFISKLRDSYGTSEKSCPDIDDSFIGFDKFAEPAFDEEELINTLTYKAAEINSSIAGRILVELTIISDGSILKAQVLRGVHNEIDRMISNAFFELKFLPCIKAGKPASCKKIYVVKIN